MAATMKAVQVSRPGGSLELVERPVPEPGPGEVRIQVDACGICHGDAAVLGGHFPGIEYPRIPGHEVVGTIDVVASDVAGWEAGQRVGVGWHGGHCFVCAACRSGRFNACENGIITGISVDGGYAEFMVARVEALVRLPEGMSEVEDAPLICAGRTTFGALQNSGARAGDTVAVLGLGGLGHLAVQYARKMGYRTVAISRGPEKRGLAEALGAEVYIDSAEGETAHRLNELGGARVILCTAPSGKAISEAFDGLAPNGQAVVVSSAADPITIPTGQLLRGRSVKGSVEGSIDDAIRFSLASGVHPMVEVFPLSDTAAAFDKMMSSKVHFRSVLKMR